MNNIMDVYMQKIDKMRFVSIDELFIKKKSVKEHFSRLTLDEREIYKWYFFYQLCMLKWRSQDRKYIKDAFWDYLHDNEKDSEINRLYLEFCIYRDNQYKK